MAVTCTPAELRALDFNGTDFPDPPYTDTVLQLFIDQALCLIGPCDNEELASKAACYLAAHFAAVFKNGGGINGSMGQVTAEAAGGLSRSYGAVMSGGNDAALTKTGYGQQFIMFRDAMPCAYVPLVLC